MMRFWWVEHFKNDAPNSVLLSADGTAVTESTSNADLQHILSSTPTLKLGEERINLAAVAGSKWDIIAAIQPFSDCNHSSASFITLNLANHQQPYLY
jgi:hypothetical protein